ncbi:SDR family oxidoreductase [Spirochaetota bacterium]
MSDKKSTVVVAGAAGRLGKHVVNELLKRNYKVKAMIVPPFDSPDTPELLADGIEIAEGSLESVDKIKEVLKGADYLISAIGSTKPFSNKTFEKIDVQGNFNLAIAAKELGIKNFIVISSIGAGDSRDALSTMFKLMMWTVLKKKTEMEGIIKNSGVIYTIIRPGGYTEKPASDEIAIGEGGKISGLIRRDQVAKFCVDAIEKETMKNRTFEIVDSTKMNQESKEDLIEI